MKQSTDSGLVKYIAAIVAIIMMSTLLAFVVLAFFNSDHATDAAEIVKLVLPSSLTGVLGLAAGGAISGEKK